MLTKPILTLLLAIATLGCLATLSQNKNGGGYLSAAFLFSNDGGEGMGNIAATNPPSGTIGWKLKRSEPTPLERLQFWGLVVLMGVVAIYSISVLGFWLWDRWTRARSSTRTELIEKHMNRVITFCCGCLVTFFAAVNVGSTPSLLLQPESGAPPISEFIFTPDILQQMEEVRGGVITGPEGENSKAGENADKLAEDAAATTDE